MELEGDGDTNYNWCTWNNPLRIGKRTGRFENKRTNGNHQSYHIIKIGQNTERNPGNLKRFDVTPNPMEHLQMALT